MKKDIYEELFGAYTRRTEGPFREFGCHVIVIDGTDLYAVADGDTIENAVEVTAPEPEFIAAVNARFGTEFKFENFAGR